MCFVLYKFIFLCYTCIWYVKFVWKKNQCKKLTSNGGFTHTQFYSGFIVVYSDVKLTLYSLDLHIFLSTCTVNPTCFNLPCLHYRWQLSRPFQLYVTSIIKHLRVALILRSKVVIFSFICWRNISSLHGITLSMMFTHPNS